MSNTAYQGPDSDRWKKAFNMVPADVVALMTERDNLLAELASWRATVPSEGVSGPEQGAAGGREQALADALRRLLNVVDNSPGAIETVSAVVAARAAIRSAPPNQEGK